MVSRTRNNKVTLVKPDITPDEPAPTITKPIPMSDATRRVINDAGKLGATRLYEMLGSAKFDKLRGSDQVALINQALNRAYGTPDSNKTVAPLELSSDSADAVAMAMRKIAHAELPERGGVIDITPISPSRGDA